MEEEQRAVPQEAFFSAETASTLESVRMVGADRTPFPRREFRNLSSAKKISTMPYAVLLPVIGELSRLGDCSEMLAARLKVLQSAPSASDEVARAMVAEEGMLNQSLQWLTTAGDPGEPAATLRREYTDEELTSLYELGRMYYEMGYFGPAERIFTGLSVVDMGRTPARLALGVVKLERGQYEESANQLRVAIRDGVWPVESKLALAIGFLARGERKRAQSMLADLRAEIDSSSQVDDDVRTLYRALLKRCG